MDDFGTGYSSLAYLMRFPVRTLKIDRSFVHEMERSREAATIVRAIASLAHSLGLDVVGEGVENVAQLALLQELGCHHIQGFLFSRPLAPNELALFSLA
ncbi:MAG: EAL domain-containing protein [Zoogloea sp.]|uniref:EAL domain-containing protein n=1 Tax=Zoogloea sp. TaxID=49181 RepID=UPI002613B8EE|nr:EAL domain-containing protein [Zoogloea sp.]MDD2989696.1 EAL domain-containing protein [Zoogloea sp.]